MDYLVINSAGESANTREGQNMETTMTAKMTDDGRIRMEISFSGKGWNDHGRCDSEAKKYMDDALDLGMVYESGRFTCDISATSEACQPFIKFSDKYGLEIIQM